MSIKNYIWLANVLEKLPERLPGALMLYGQKGIGKELLAESLSQSLLCLNSGGAGYPCGNCDGCHLFKIGNHPDFRRLQPEKDAEEGVRSGSAKDAGSKKASRFIGVDAVRELAGLTTIATHRGGAKVILITSAESLHTSAGNALLKMLEEPGHDTYFILVTNERSRILPTIRSRCFQLSVKAPVADVGASWLKGHDAKHADVALSLASYAPLAALELIEDEEFWTTRNALVAELADASADPLSLAGIAEKLEPATLGRILGMWVLDLLLIQQRADARYHRDMPSELERTASKLSGTDLCHWNDEIRDFSRAADHPLNRRLALESLFAKWPGSKYRATDTKAWSVGGIVNG